MPGLEALQDWGFGTMCVPLCVCVHIGLPARQLTEVHVFISRLTLDSDNANGQSMAHLVHVRALIKLPYEQLPLSAQTNIPQQIYRASRERAQIEREREREREEGNRNVKRGLGLA